jgi:hypothetical protein
MNNALLSQIQSGKGLKKVAAHEKNDRSEVKGTGAVVGSSNNNSRGKRTLSRGNRILLQLFIGASRGPPMPPGGGRKPGGPAAGGTPMHGLGGIRAQLNAQFGGSSIPAKPTR